MVNFYIKSWMNKSIKLLVIGLMLSPSIFCIAQSSTQFGDKEALAFLKANPSYKFMDKAKNSEKNIYVFVSPYPNKFYPRGYPPDKPTEFHSIDIKSDSSREEQLVGVNCEKQTFDLSAPDKNGVFRYFAWEEKMPPALFKGFCETNWSKEVIAARKELKEMIRK